MSTEKVSPRPWRIVPVPKVFEDDEQTYDIRCYRERTDDLVAASMSKADAEFVVRLANKAK